MSSHVVELALCAGREVSMQSGRPMRDLPGRGSDTCSPISLAAISSLQLQPPPPPPPPTNVSFALRFAARPGHFRRHFAHCLLTLSLSKRLAGERANLAALSSLVYLEF